VIAELGDLTRFDHPRKLMSNLGLFPSEHSSGGNVVVKFIKPHQALQIANAAVIGVFCEVEFWCKVAKPHQKEVKQKCPIDSLVKFHLSVALILLITS
jgi:hypothetical protein